MIIWSGFGILAILSLIIAGVTTTLISALLDGAIGKPASILVGGIVGGVVGAVANLLLSRLLGGTPRTMIDQATGQTVEMRRNNSLFCLPMGCWSPIIAVGGLAFGIIGFIGERRSSELSAKYPGKAAFDKATESIVSSSKGTWNGNSPDAEAAARVFSQMAKKLQSVSFSGGSKKNFLTGGEFLTYCHKTKDGLIFLCHVPSLRSYKDESVKTSLRELTWTCAQVASKRVESITKDSALTVGLGGIGGIEFINHGTVGDDLGASHKFTEFEETLYTAFDPANDGAQAAPRKEESTPADPTEAEAPAPAKTDAPAAPAAPTDQSAPEEPKKP